MATREELRDPDYLPYEGELRYLSHNDRSGKVLQQFQSKTGWSNISQIHPSEIPTGGVKPNTRNA